jgi:hypothetical protein
VCYRKGRDKERGAEGNNQDVTEREGEKKEGQRAIIKILHASGI